MNEGDYVGRPVGEVVGELRGPRPQRAARRAGQPRHRGRDTVDGVNPSGTLEEGDTVTVSYWGPAPVEPSTPTEPTEPPPTTETTATEPSAPASSTGDAGATPSTGAASPSASAISEEDQE